VKPWVESSKEIQAPAGAAENKRTVLSVAPLPGLLIFV
jgi:hypothetical protein